MEASPNESPVLGARERPCLPGKGHPLLRRTLKGLVNVALLLASSVLALAIVEVGMRLHFYRSLARPDHLSHMDLMRPHPTRGWTLAPNSFTQVRKRDYKTGVYINSKGLRDVEHAYDRTPGVFRILVLGDSFMEAQQVPLADALPALVEKQLAPYRVDVINAGVNGYNTTQELIYLQEEGFRYRPDLVLLAFYGANDVVENCRSLMTMIVGTDNRLSFARPYATWDAASGALRAAPPDYARAVQTYEDDRAALTAERAARGLMQRSILHELYDDYRVRRDQESHLAKNDAHVRCGVFLDDMTPLVQEAEGPTVDEYRAMFDDAWNVTERLILEMNGLVRRKSARFVILLVPSKAQVEPDYRQTVERTAGCGTLDVFKPHRRVQAFADEDGIPVCDLLPRLIKEQEKTRGALYFNWDDDHWTGLGHRIAADETAQYLVENGLINRTDQTDQTTDEG